MKNEKNIWIAVATAAVVGEGWALLVLAASPARWRPTMIVDNEPRAQALYETMKEAAGQARTLTYRCMCTGPDSEPSSCTVQLKKPNLLRIDLTNGMSTRVTTLLADGERLRIFWSGDRPFLKVDDFERYDQTRSNVYLDTVGPPDGPDIVGEITRLGLAWSNLVWSPNVFFGGADEFEPCIDGIRYRGANTVRGQECDVIEVSYFHAQRTRHYWLSREDHLPRRIKEIVRLADNHLIVEEWYRVEIDERIADETFAWTPPEGFRRWTPPELDEFLPAPGTEVPDFELPSASGDTIRLSDLRSSVVWLCLWQVGSPECRRQMRYLQSVHQKAVGRGLAIVGVNVADDRRIAQAFLREDSIAFPCALDPSEATAAFFAEEYGLKPSDSPVNYVVGADGKLIDAWHGYDVDGDRARTALQKARVPGVLE